MSGNESNGAANILEYLQLVGKLKHLKRTGWVLRGVKEPESVASHMYRMAMMTFVLEDTSLDRIRCLEMALVHDLGESLIGDFTPTCGISKEEKHRLETDAIAKIGMLMGNKGNVNELFEEYEDQKTPESKFVKDLDLFDMALQAFEYEKAENNPGRLQEFIDSTNGKFKHPEVIRIAEEMYKQRSIHINSKSDLNT